MACAIATPANTAPPVTKIKMSIGGIAVVVAAGGGAVVTGEAAGTGASAVDADVVAADVAGDVVVVVGVACSDASYAA